MNEIEAMSYFNRGYKNGYENGLELGRNEAIRKVVRILNNMGRDDLAEDVEKIMKWREDEDERV